MAFFLRRSLVCRVSGVASFALKYSAPTVSKTIFPPLAFKTNSHIHALPLRYASQDVKEVDEVKDKSSLRVLWDYVKDHFSDPQLPAPSEEEENEFQDIRNRYMDMIYDVHPKTVGTAIFEEYFDCCIKWDNWIRAEHMWNYCDEWQIEFNDDQLDKIEDYLIAVRQRPFYSKGKGVHKILNKEWRGE